MELDLPSIPTLLIWGLIILLISLGLIFLIFSKNTQGVSYIASLLEVLS